MEERFPEFDRREFEARWERTHSLMTERGLDALLVTSESNYRYLSGHVTHFWVSKSRPLSLVMPRRGQPTLVVTSSQEAAARATSWIDDVRACDGFAPEAVDLLAQTVRELSLDRACIGAELGHEQRLGLPYAEFRRLQDLLPEAVFVDAADLFWNTRLIKSPAEIALIRRSAAISSQAYRELFSQLREGMTEREVFGAFAASTFEQGAERLGYVPVVSGGNYRRYHAGATDRPLGQGDLLWMDGGCVFRGYWSDFSRMAAIGRASEQQRARYRAVRTLTHACLREARPGVRILDLMRRAAAEFEEAGLPLSSPSRIGHGIGLDITEPPSINMADQTVIQPGMVLTMEPSSAAESGMFQTEENFVITAGGAELLSEPAPEELPAVGG